MIRCELLLNLKFTIRFWFGSESSLAFGTWPWSHGVLVLDDSLHLQTGKVCCLPRAKDQEGASICQEYKLLPSVTLSSQHDSNRKKVSLSIWMHEKWLPSLTERLLTVGFKLVVYLCNCHVINCYHILCHICGCLVYTLNIYAYAHILSSWEEGCLQSYIDQHFLSPKEFLTQIKCSYYGFRNQMPLHCWHFQKLDIDQIPGK